MGSLYGLETGSPNRALIKSSSIDISFFRRVIMVEIFSMLSTTLFCSSKDGRSISIEETIDFDISLKVAPLPSEFK